ncbi:MAG: hypothetical protein KF767_16435 [Bdellovibrionaceae bacterium]|nr:hypothetical protein [Pseudobdellovibrionaceae bacterium]
MRTSLILAKVAKLIFWPLLVFSFILYWRGHNAEGGGFIGGLVAAAAFGVIGFSFGVHELRRRLYFHPVTYLTFGLACAYGAGALGWWAGSNFLKSLWVEVPVIEKLGSTALFDLGVYAIVLGMVSLIITNLMSDGGIE